MSQSEAVESCNAFFEWVRGLIPKDKFEIFLSLFKFPISTNEITEQIFGALEKVFDGRNPFFQYEFMNSDLLTDWEEYRTERLNEPKVWNVKGFNQMKTAINSILIVDLPDNQTSTIPEPYFYWLDISNVLDFDTTKKGEFEHIIFKQHGDKIAVFDDTSYRIFEYKDNKLGAMITESQHSLGYCPARFFWTTMLKSSVPELKKSPMSNQLGKLDWLLFFATSKQHLDLYAPYPIYSGYEQECDYEDTNTGAYCEGGFIKNASGKYQLSRIGTVERCPVCSDKRIAGVGSFVEIPIPSGENNNADMRNPVQITTIDKDSLAYNVSEVDRIKYEIYTNVVGLGGDLENDKAVNEKQIAASFESRTTVLLNLKRNFEAAQKWVDDTILTLRYGEQFYTSTINYGTEFYMYSAKELTTQYKEAKESGTNDAYLDTLSDQITETENRNNSTQLQRAKIMKHLEPYRHMTKQEVLDAYKNDKDLINRDELLIKLNLSTFVIRFERENTNIVDFASLLSFDKKINIIKQKLIEYGNEGKSQTGN